MSDHLIAGISQASSSERLVPHSQVGQAHAHEAGAFKLVMDQYLSGADPIHKSASGQIDEIHKVTAAMEEAETSFKLMMEIHNKLLDAYHELNNMR